MVNFSEYLRFVITDYAKQRNRYTLTDLRVEFRQEGKWVSEQLPLEQELSNHPGVEQKQEQQDDCLEVLAGLRQYVQRGHVLLVGKPGLGKSTALKQLRWQLAEAALVDAQQPIPVLVALRKDYSIAEAIKIELLKGNVDLEEREIKQLLQRQQFFLLLDGLHEIRSKQREDEIRQFRRDHPHTPMVFTSRGLGIELGIAQKLEMCKLTDEQIRTFVEKYLPNHAEMLLRQLNDYLRDLAETPLFLKILCEIFDSKTQQFPWSQGELLRILDARFNTWKESEGARTAEKFWQWHGELLRGLAFGMFQADGTPTRKLLQIERGQAEHLLEQFLQGRVAAPGEKAKDWLQDLLEHHLLQVAANPNEIEFHHQLLQEYYAAEYLLRQLPKLSNDQLKQNYLNLLKWTDSLAVMMSLSNVKEALLIVKLAREVDWILGMRLAGKVKPEFQSQTMGVMNDLDLPEWLKAKFWKEPQPDIDRIATSGVEKIYTEADLPDLLKIMEHKNASVRAAAAGNLGSIKTEATIQILLQVLTNQEEEDSVRKAAALALGKVGTEVAIPTLLQEALRANDRSSLRQATVFALGEIGTESSISALCEVVAADEEENDAFGPIEWRIPEFAKSTLREIRTKTAIPGLLKALEHGSLDVQMAAAEALGEIGSETAIPALLKAAEDGSGSAMTVLAKISIEVAIPALMRALENRSSNFSTAAKLLGEIRYEPAIPGLIEILTNYQGWYPTYEAARKVAAAALGKIGSEVAIPALLQAAVTDKTSSVREQAVAALGKITTRAAIPDLLQAMEHKNVRVRRAAAAALGNIGSEVAIPVLLQTIEDDDEYSVRETAVAALGKIGCSTAVPNLIRALTRGSVPKATVVALGEIGSEAAVPALIQALTNDTRDSVRKAAVVALGEIGSEAAVPALIQTMEDDDGGGYRHLYEAAVVALGKIGSEAAIPALSHALVDKKNFITTTDQFVRTTIVKALGDISSDEAVPALLQALADKDSGVRRTAAKALGDISSDEAIPALLRVLEDNNNYVREKAAEALENISTQHIEAVAFQIPHLIKLVTTNAGKDAFQVLTAIQFKSQFYNWTIQNENLTAQNEKDSQKTPEAWLQTLTEEVQKMSNQPKHNFSGVNFNAPVNFGDNPTGDFIGTQNNYTTDPEVQSTVNDLKILINNLQAQYPTLANETHALAIIDAEFTEIKQDKTNKLATLRKQLLNPERHLQATKATLVEVSKHYLEESVWAKAAITYFDKLSEEPDHGA